MYRSHIVLLVSALALVACDKKADEAASDPAPAGAAAASEVRIVVGAHGYEPAEAQAPANKPVRLVFTRTSDEGCGQQLVFPSLDIRKDLPLNQPVSVDVTMPASGSIAFTCGMDMYRGSIVAR
jgi:plastocyanin domain-containing protein